MQTVSRVLAIALLFSLIQFETSSGQTVSTSVTGSVFDDASRPLPGATVYLVTLDRGAVTDESGRFRFAGVPAGQHTIRVSYIGFQTEEQTIMVDGPESVQFILVPGILEGGEVTIVGDRLAGEAMALNQQRANLNVSNVVSTDQIGKFPDSNIGDALKRIPAITVAYDQGEARFASIRGAAPQLNSVLINGERLPSAEAEIRIVTLDLIPSDMIQTIEVNKVVTPDMDADAIGGSVNLVTRAPSGGQRLSLTVGSGYNSLRDKATSNVAAVFGNRFADGKLGVVVSGSYFNNRLGSDNSEGEWDEDDGSFFVNEWDIRRYDLQRIRRSIATSLDYRFSPSSVVYLRGMYNHRNDYENRVRARYQLDVPNASGIVERTEIRRQTKGGNSDTKDARLEDQRASSISLEGEHLVGKLLIDWQTSASQASEERPNERYIEWRLRGVPVAVGIADPEKPTFTFVNAADNVAGNYSLREITEEFQDTEQNDRTARIDFTLPFMGVDVEDGSIKFGYRLRSQDKMRDNRYFEYEPLGDGFDAMSDQSLEDYSEADYLAGPYLIGLFTTPEFLSSLDLTNRSLFEETDAVGEYAAGNYESMETIHAGYAMVTRRLTPSLTGVAGVRIEATSATFNGFEYNDDTDAVRSVDGKSSYTDVLPSVLFRYEANPNTIIRLAWTNTLARPGFYELVPYREIAVEDNELSIGNPDLKPTRSMNLDLMAERYFTSVGLVSAGVFYKDISDFIYTLRERNTVDAVSGTTFDAIFRPVNGADASLFGLEFSLQRQIEAIRGLGMFVNYTFTESSTENPQFSAETIDLPGSAKHSLNTSLSFARGPADVRVSFNYNSSFVDPGDVDLTPGLERIYDAVTYLDVNGSIKASRNALVFFSANNLLNQPLRYYAGDKSRTYQAEYYGPTFTLGAKYDLR